MLSPAYCGGRRAGLLLRPGSALTLAARLRAGTLSLGEAFAFMSGLYFRGKLTYARTFTGDAAGRILVITPTRGLVPPETCVTVEVLQEFATVDVDAGDARYSAPLARDAARLAAALPPHADVVLLGSIATGKYVEVLARHLAGRLVFPPAFIGRGDMSRGGLLLRQAAAGEELSYAVLDPTADRRGPRPPKLAALPRR